ncbi:MAG TPA: UDP-N-acetylglucosamine 1-carboxyvinyltransferase [Firmicutes bacterium]|nr:UDP-N-acetylglucosamine 1-carboxyvinyltransferase [Bacillota bacterium]
MQFLEIEGGKALHGRIGISGAKNAVLKLMAACLLTAGECVIRNVPRIRDVRTMVEILRGLGAKVEWEESGEMRITSGEELTFEAPDKSARQMRASIQVLGPLLARLRRARIAHPGGCAIGARPVDLHLMGLRKMGAVLVEEYGYISGWCRELTGQDIYLDYPSVGATENLMMAAALAKGTTVIYNGAREPEIIEVQNFLNCMGAKIRGAGTDIIRITGVDELHGADYTVVPDRIEAGTFMVAAAITGGELILAPVIMDHLQLVVAKLREAGVVVEAEGESVYVKGSHRLAALTLRSAPYPGFPTDMQPQFTAMLTKADGISLVSESVYTNRFHHVDELVRMGADIAVDGRLAIIRGPRRLTGAQVQAGDLRAGAAVVLAALAADGITQIGGVEHIDRGYERLEEKLRLAGALVARRESVTVEEPVLV